VLAVLRTRGHLAWAVADPWEIRSTGCMPSTRHCPTAITRIIRRERPTAIVLGSRSLAPVVGHAARGMGLGLIRERVPPIPIPIARDLCPEFPLYAPTRSLERVTALAIAAVLHAQVPSRQYAKHRRRRISLHAA